MRIIVPEGMEVVRSHMLTSRQVVIDSGSGRVWSISTAFEGRGIYVRPDLGSVGDVMHVYPVDRSSVQLVQESTQ